MASFEALLIEQRSTFKQFRRILPNFRKIGKDRFSASKTRTRIQNLQESWSACKALDVQLRLKASDAQSRHAYFLDEELLNAEADYEEIFDQLTDILD